MHAYSKHGKEAEELRAGIEDIISKFTTSCSRQHPLDVTDALRELINGVDARDSLNWLEKVQKVRRKTVRGQK